MATADSTRKRKGSQGPGWQKNTTFLENKKARKRRDEDIASQLSKRMENLYTLCKTPAAYISYFNGSLHHYGNNIAMKNFCGDAEVQKIFSKYLSRSEEKDIVEDIAEETSACELMIPDDWMDVNINRKRGIVRQLVKVSCGGKASWNGARPSWWPENIVFGNPTGSSKPNTGDCISIIQSFIDSHSEFMVTDPLEDIVDEDNVEEELVHNVQSFTETNCVSLLSTFDRIDNTRTFLSEMHQRLETLQLNAFQDRVFRPTSVDIWQRAGNPLVGYEPILTKGDGNCLYRAVSTLLFEDDKEWAFLKLGSLLYALLHIDDITDKILADSTFAGKLGFPHGDASSCSREEIKKELKHETNHHAPNGKSSGCLQFHALANFSKATIHLFISKDLPSSNAFSGVFEVDDTSWAKISILGSCNKFPPTGVNHFLALGYCEPYIESDSCGANEFCKTNDGHCKEKCNFCHLNYHRVCLDQPVGDSAFHCGCHLVGVIGDRISWLADVNQVGLNFDRYERKIMNLLQKKLSRQLKCGRLTAFHKFIMGNKELLLRMNSWFTTLENETITTVQLRLKSAISRHNLMDTIASFSSVEESVKVMLQHYCIPETFVIMMSEQLRVPRLAVERFTKISC